MRFTRQAKASAVASTKAGLTDAPPVETSRRLATRSARNRLDAVIWEKKMGGAPMNVTRSSSMSRRPSSGSQPAMSTLGMPAAAGSRTPFSSPDTCARGAGMSTASLGPSPWTATIEVAL